MHSVFFLRSYCALLFDLMHFHFIFVMSFTVKSKASQQLFLFLIVGPLSISDIVAASDNRAKVRISYKVWSQYVWVMFATVWFDPHGSLLHHLCLDYWFRGYQDHSARKLQLKLTLIVKQSHAVILKKLLRF